MQDSRHHGRCAKDKPDIARLRMGSSEGERASGIHSSSGDAARPNRILFKCAFRRFLNRVAHFKNDHGVAFVVVAAVLAGAVVPELFVILFFQRGRFRRENLRNLAFTIPTWGIDGILVDLMYRLNAVWFGDVTTVWVVTAKILVDQLGYNPFFAAPAEVLVYEWKNEGFSWKSVRRAFTWEHYRDKIVPTLLATWAVWGPLMAIIYSLPFALQFPLFSIALTFWVLLLTYMTNRFAGKIEADAPPALSVASGD
jgi:hypothetical protein